MGTPGCCILYRFRLHPGAEDRFVRAWSAITRGLLEHRGALGSRLHRGPDGLWYAYAQWPSAEARRLAFEQPAIDPEASVIMKSAIAEQLPEIVLDPVADFLQIEAAE